MTAVIAAEALSSRLQEKGLERGQQIYTETSWCSSLWVASDFSFFSQHFKARVWAHLAPKKVAATFFVLIVSVPWESQGGEPLTPWKLPQVGRKACPELGTEMQMMGPVQWVREAHRSVAWRSPKSQTVGCVALPAKRIGISLVLPQPAIVSACPEQSWQHSHACKHQQTKYTKSMHGYFW